MKTPAVYTKSGTKATTSVKLDKTIFGVEISSHDLLKQAYLAYMANGRVNLAKTKTRGLVRGGGKKPWRQKGTGRARFGSSRNPIWRGGGIVFGPTGNENYTRKLSTTSKRQAIRQALSLANEAGKCIIIDSFESKDAKVKTTTQLLKKINATRNVLLVVDNKDEAVDRATRNIPQLVVVQAMYVNVYDVLNADSIVITKKALEMIQEWLKASTDKGDK